MKAECSLFTDNRQAAVQSLLEFMQPALPVMTRRGHTRLSNRAWQAFFPPIHTAMWLEKKTKSYVSSYNYFQLDSGDTWC